MDGTWQFLFSICFSVSVFSNLLYCVCVVCVNCSTASITSSSVLQPRDSLFPRQKKTVDGMLYPLC